jgi:hypothetical protein
MGGIIREVGRAWIRFWHKNAAFISPLVGEKAISTS